MTCLARYIPHYLFIIASLLLTACGGGNNGGTPADDSPSSGGGSPPVLISSFAPSTGKVGTRVQIDGLVFDNTPSNNTVTFNGINATVIASTTYEIVVDVPAGATSGPIQISTTTASATSSQDFTVVTDTTTPGLSWTGRLNGIPGDIRKSASNGTITVLVGDNVHTSTDHRYWKEVNNFYSGNDILWDGQQFVTVGSGSNVSTSPDGISWTQQSTFGAPSLEALTKTADIWIAVGDGGIVRTSADAINWVTQTTPTTENLKDVAWNGTTITAVGENGTVMTSTDDGISWVLRDADTNSHISALATNGSLFVASTDFNNPAQGALLSSSDGITWALREPNVNYLFDLIYANNLWLGVGFNFTYTSPDAITWTRNVRDEVNDIGILYTVTHTGSEFIATGSTGVLAGGVFRSIDGQNWSKLNTELPYRSIARSPVDGRIVVSNYTGQTLTSTDDGMSWTFGNDSGFLFTDITWSNALNLFVGIKQIGANTGVYTSSDGINWTDLQVGAPNNGITSSDSLLVAVDGGVGFGLISTSPDGTNWTARNNPATYGLIDAIWTGSQFIAFGSEGNILTSPDGSTWVLRNSGVTARLFAATTSPSLLIIVGDGGIILTSDDDGVSWISRNSTTTFNLNAVAWTGNEYVAVGNSGRSVYSVNGIDWTEQPNQFNRVPFLSDPYNFNAMVWNGNDRLIVVGDRGLIVTSP